MCIPRQDVNKVTFTGQAIKDTLNIYKAKGQDRCEFGLRSDFEGIVTKIVIQFRGQKAHDAFALYEPEREFGIEGRLKYRRGGRWCVVVNNAKPFGVGDRVGKMSVEDLLAMKVKAFHAGQPIPPPAEDVVENDPVPYNEILDEALMEDTPVAEPGMVFVSQAHDDIGRPVEVDINGNPMEPISPEDQEGLMVDREEEEADGDVATTS